MNPRRVDGLPQFVWRIVLTALGVLVTLAVLVAVAMLATG